MLFLYLCAALVFSATAAKIPESEYAKKEDLQHLIDNFAKMKAEIATLKANQQQHKVQEDAVKKAMSASNIDGEIAFHASLRAYDTIPIGSTVIFSYVNVNLGLGYDESTGQFTVPVGGAGLYYFYVHFRVSVGEEADLDMRRNGGDICIAYEDERNGGDSGSASCGAVMLLEEGDVVDAYYDWGTDDTPLNDQDTNVPFHSFTGFRIAAS